MTTIDGITAPAGGFQQGGWYNGRQYWNGTLSAPGVINSSSNQQGAGQAVSNEVVKQTSPSNLPYIQGQVAAQNLVQPQSITLPSGNSAATGMVSGLQGAVDTARANLESTLGAKKATIEQELKVLKEKEQQTLDKIGVASTPFREDLETKERERLYINQNFEENQTLVNELDTLLTEGNNLIKQQQEVTGISAIRNPRVQKTINDVAARAGVIQAVMSARNSQISVAENMIDRTVSAINADRKDEISYYETILNLNNRDIVSLDKQSQDIANEQLGLIKGDLERAQATQDYVKKLLIDPATAGLLGQAGVTLNDSVESINGKLAQAQYVNEVREASNEISLKGGVAVVDPSKVPADRLITIVDSKGVKHYYQTPADKTAAVTPGSTRAKIAEASKQDMSYADFVVNYANYMDLADIREAYMQSTRGKQFGIPQENSREIALLYKVSKGEMTPTDAERELAR